MSSLPLCPTCNSPLSFDDNSNEWFCEKGGEEECIPTQQDTTSWYSDWLEAQKEYNLPEYSQESYKKFCADLFAEGFELRTYNGRYGFCGPACVTDDIQEVIRCTTVSVQWDSLGFQKIVYPK